MKEEVKVEATEGEIEKVNRIAERLGRKSRGQL